MQLINVDELIRNVEKAEIVTGERLDVFRYLIDSCRMFSTINIGAHTTVGKEEISRYTELGIIDDFIQTFRDELGRDIGKVIVQEGLVRYRREDWPPTDSIIIKAGVMVVDSGKQDLKSIDLRPLKPFQQEKEESK